MRPLPNVLYVGIYRMNPHVVGTRYHLQILNPIVLSITVDVVDNMAGQNRATFGFPHSMVFAQPSSIRRNKRIPAALQCTTLLPFVVTRRAAEVMARLQ